MEVVWSNKIYAFSFVLHNFHSLPLKIFQPPTTFNVFLLNWEITNARRTNKRFEEDVFEEDFHTSKIVFCQNKRKVNTKEENVKQINC